MIIANAILLLLPLVAAVFTVLIFLRDKKVKKQNVMKVFSATLLSVFCHNSGKHADIREVHDIFIGGVL